MKTKLLLLVGLIALLACRQNKDADNRVTTLPYYDEATFTPHWIEEGDAVLDTFHQISSFDLINQDGQQITEQTFANKIYVVDFFFTVCPGICPRMTDNMRILQEEFLEDQDVLLMSHSVTPERDTVSVLRDYADEKGVISGKWHLVTGAQEEIYRLGRHEYFVEEDLGLEKEEDDFLHTENFVLIDQNRHIRGIYNGLNKTSINHLITDIRSLQAYSSLGHLVMD